MNNMSKFVISVGVCIVLSLAFTLFVYNSFRIDVPEKNIAILTKLTGDDLLNDQEISPNENTKGPQEAYLTEGRHFRNPYSWRWQVLPMEEIEVGELGVKIRLSGDDLPYGEIIAWEPNDKGIVPQVLRPGRYAINPYVEKIEKHKPITIPAGFRGVQTLLAAPMPENPNVLLVESGKRGVQKDTLEEGTYYINPYTTRVNLADCRSQRFNLGSNGSMGFPSKDGFWVELEAIIEFRVKPEMAADVFVTYNDEDNGSNIDEEIINKIITPNARSFCRLRGSDHKGQEFIGGETRMKFQEDFQTSMISSCGPLGIEIIQALITRILPPQAIATPIRKREIAEQDFSKYTQQILQQESQQKLAIEKETIKQKSRLVEAAENVIKSVTLAEQEQAVAVTKANEELKVAELKLEAAVDEAAAIVARGTAKANIIKLQNEAEAAGWAKAVEAFDGDGEKYAQFIFYTKVAPGFKKIMANSGTSSLMDIFNKFDQNKISQPLTVPSPVVTE